MKLDQLVGAKGYATMTRRWLCDLRRNIAAGLQRLSVRFEVTEAVLNPVGGSRSGVAGIYQRHDWNAEKREAFDRWMIMPSPF